MKKKTYLDEKFWIEQEGSCCRIGLTKGFVSTFDHIDWIDLPKVGTELQKGDPSVILESAKAAIDIESPLSGIVKEVNQELINTPEKMTEDDWLFCIEAKPC